MLKAVTSLKAVTPLTAMLHLYFNRAGIELRRCLIKGRYRLLKLEQQRIIFL